MINPAVEGVAEHLTVRRACALLGRAPASHYRSKQPPLLGPSRPRPVPGTALTDTERGHVLDTLTSDRFCDKSVAHVWAVLLDEGTYLCSQSTMHRILRAADAAGERRRHATHPAKRKPELLATTPGQVWSWDITKVRGPDRGIWFQLYVIIDIYSRYVVGWTVQRTENSHIAEAMIAEAITVHGAPDALHADRGTSMTSKPVAALLMDLGVDRSHSRPRVSNDNPYSEAAFKTLKYAPAFPEKFGSLTDARAFCQQFFNYYNHEHRHSGIGLHTPASVHHGTAEQIRTQRQATLDQAYHTNPARFGHRRPHPPKLPTAAWINQPLPEPLIQSA